MVYSTICLLNKQKNLIWRFAPITVTVTTVESQKSLHCNRFVCFKVEFKNVFWNTSYAYLFGFVFLLSLFTLNVFKFEIFKNLVIMAYRDYTKKYLYEDVFIFDKNKILSSYNMVNI